MWHKPCRTFHLWCLCIKTRCLLMRVCATTPQSVLTHHPLDKMAAILADDNSNCIFLNKHTRIPIRISLKCVLTGPTDNTPAFAQVMAWHRIGDKPLPEPMLTQFTDAYKRHEGVMLTVDDQWNEVHFKSQLILLPDFRSIFVKDKSLWHNSLYSECLLTLKSFTEVTGRVILQG